MGTPQGDGRGTRGAAARAIALAAVAVLGLGIWALGQAGAIEELAPSDELTDAAVGSSAEEFASPASSLVGVVARPALW